MMNSVRNRRMVKAFIMFVLLLMCGVQSTMRAEKNKPKRVVNIINFIRLAEPRYGGYSAETLYQSLYNRTLCMRKHALKGTYLIQYDALKYEKYHTLLKEEMQRGCEVGGWWEITQPHVEAIGMKWRGRYFWDWHTNVGFSVGYTPKEREQLVDEYMKKFKDVFGFYPKTVGSWFIDAYTLQYMRDKYNVIVSCNCRDQVGTDGYTLWGGYWGQAYYPSRVNAYMPAQTEDGQIDIPVFRMLGSDPVYQYDAGVGGAVQYVFTLEPVSKDGGKKPSWVDWYFNTFANDPVKGFCYTQAGQENSFLWEPIKDAYEYQMDVIDKAKSAGTISLETLQETGVWFRDKYKVTPPTLISALTDCKGEGKGTAWYNSRYYRANLLWDNSTFKIRDIHLFNQDVESQYYRHATTSTQCRYFTLPLVDGCLWSSDNVVASMVPCIVNADGTYTEMHGGKPKVEGNEKMSVVTWPLTKKVSMGLAFKENRIIVVCNDKAHDWALLLKTAPGAQLPFTEISSRTIKAEQDGFAYHSELRCGEFVDLRGRGDGSVLLVKPQSDRIIWQMHE